MSEVWEEVRTEVWERVIWHPGPLPNPKRTTTANNENKIVIELDDEEAAALSRLLARYVISLGEECPTLTDLAVKL